MAGIRRNPEAMKMPSRQELLNVIEKIYNLEHRALICFLYLTGARIGELLDIKKYQLEFDTIKGTPFLIINNVKTLKRRTPVFRRVPIPLTKREQPFLKPFLDFIKPLEQDELLFKFDRKKAWAIVKDKTYLFPHYLRHIRLTHLKIEHGFDALDLKQFTGWKDTRPAETYAHLDVRSIAEKMTKDNR